MAINVSTLLHDGPATPEQLALVVPITGATDADTVAWCRYRKKNTASPAALGQDGAWVTSHQLFRTQSSASLTPAVGSVSSVFAWTIIGLETNTPYEVEVTVSSPGDANVVRTTTFTTRGLPPRAGKPNKTIAAGAHTSTIQAAFNGLVAGDVIQFADDTYTVSSLTVDVAGTAGSPIYIRGATREGTILHDTTGTVLELLDVSDLIVENLTIKGAETDSGTSSNSVGIAFGTASSTQLRVTIRDCTIHGVDKGIVASDEIQQALVYNNVLVGNNAWTGAMLSTSITWNDDGIRVPGSGNCVFQNTLHCFGDSLSFAQHSGGDTETENIGIHFYRNEIRKSCDDMVEGDHAHRNCTVYDNRGHNVMTMLSLDPLYGGPFLYARNIAINIGRSPYKFNSQNSGHFVYNNTYVRTNGAANHTDWGWVQYSNGAQEYWGYRNNIGVYVGTGDPFAFESAGNTSLDFTHNSWYPNGDFWWTNSGGTRTSLAATSSLSAVTAVFSGATTRHANDNITVSSPWTAAVTVGADYLTAVSSTYTPTVSTGDNAKNSGIAIPNITDGFSGAAPDRGAVIAGRQVPVYGNALPAWVKALAIGEWTPLSSSNAVMSGDEVVTAWNGAALDAGRSWLLSVGAGGHGDGSGNAAYALKLYQATPEWVTLLPDSSSVTANVTHYSDGRPVSRHTYYGIQFDEWNDRVMIFGGSRYQDGAQIATVDSFNIGAAGYNPVSTHANIPSGVGDVYGFASTYDPRTGNIFALANQVLVLWTRSSNAWSTPSYTGSGVWGRNAMSAVDTSRGRVYFQGGDDLDNHFYDIDDNSLSTVTVSGARAADVDGEGQMGMVYVPELDVFLCRPQTAGGDVIQINASSFVASTFPTTGGTGIQATDPFTESLDGQGVFNKFIYVPNLGGCVYLNGFTKPTWFLRVVDVEATIPAEVSTGSEQVIYRGSHFGGLG